MKKSIFFVLMAIVMSTLFSCERVKPNYQGVLMENYGKNGKSDFSLQKGSVWTINPGTELFQVPLYEQRGDFGERILQLKASDNTEFTASPMYSFNIIESRSIDVVFNNKQIGSGGSGEEFMLAMMDNILEPKIYDIMKEGSRVFSTDDLMADGGSLIYEDAMEAQVRKVFEEAGLNLINFSCQIDFTDKVKTKIDNRNEVNSNIEVLSRQIEEQKMRNDLERLQTEQNIIRDKGLTDKILIEQFIAKWDGKTSLYGNTPVSVLLNK